MKFYKNDTLLLDTQAHKLNMSSLKFDEYKGAARKIIKNDSDSFNDSYTRLLNTYNGYSTNIEIAFRNIKLEEVENSILLANRIVLPKEPNYYREFYIDGNIEYLYTGEHTVMKVPIYLKAFKHFLNTTTVVINNNITKTIVNDGNVEATPIYKITGNGEVVFTVNGERNVLKNCNGFYIVNCKDGEQNVLDPNGNKKNVTSDYGGEYTKLKPGNNQIQLVRGNSLEVKVNWRKV